MPDSPMIWAIPLRWPPHQFRQLGDVHDDPPNRSEHWIVVRGTAGATIGSEIRAVHENESIYIPIGSIHRRANLGTSPLEQVQVGSYLGKDDIVRLTDQRGDN